MRLPPGGRERQKNESNKNTKLITELGIIWDAAVVWDGDRIVAAGRSDEVTIPEETEVIGAGCDEYSLIEPELYSELIMDENAVHVVPDLAKSIIKCKGPEHIILITDSMPKQSDYLNNQEAGIYYGPDLNYDDIGYLAGSRMTLESGKKANIIICDDQVNIDKVFLEGKLAVENGRVVME